MKLLIRKLNWTEHCSDDYEEIKWIISDDLKVEIEEIYGFKEKNNKHYNYLNQQDYETILKNIDLIKNNNVEDVDALDGTAWEFILYEENGDIWKKDANYIYGIKPLETIAKILETIDLNLDRKELSKILEMLHQEIKELQPNEIDNSIYLKYLQMLKEKLNSKEYSSDNRFVTYCRRDFLRQEMTDRLEQKVYTGINYLLEAFYDLEDYINNNTWISISSVCNLPNSKEIIANDTSYKNDGKICKEEKIRLIIMINEFVSKINSLENNTLEKIENTESVESKFTIPGFDEQDELDYEYFEKNLCIALIYYCLACIQKEQQCLETIYNLINDYDNIIKNNILQFNVDHPAYKHNEKLQELNNNELLKIIDNLNNKMFFCKNVSRLNEFFYEICCEDDVEILADCIVKTNNFEKAEKFIHVKLDNYKNSK